MIGLAIGSYTANKIKKVYTNLFIMSEIFVFLFSFLLPFTLILIRDLNINPIIFPLLAITFSAIAGFEFPVAARIAKGDKTIVTSKLYYSDLVGSFIGAVLVSAFLIPWLGVIETCFLVAILNFISMILAIYRLR